MAQKETTYKWPAVRLRPDVHRRLRLLCFERNQTVMRTVSEILDRYLSQEERRQQKREATA